MSAILKTEPPHLTESQQNIPPGLARTVEHCLEKEPSNRFQSARDVAFALEAFSGASSSAIARVTVPSTRSKWQSPGLLLGLGVGLLIALATFLAARKTAPVPQPPTFHQLAFQRGTIPMARFAPDGETIIYAAAWAGKPIELFSTRPEGTESRALGVPNSDLLAVASTGELAIRLQPEFTGAYSTSGTMARVMLSGGSPRPMEGNVEFADWTPDGKNLAITRREAGQTHLEFPIGKSLYQTAGWIGNPRFSPRGDLIAFVDHRSRVGDPGSIAIIDLAGHKKILAENFISAQGLAWSPQGDEVWFSATRTGGMRALYAVSLAGKERVIMRGPGILHLFDVSRAGRVLLSRDDWRVGLLALPPGASREQDLSWMDFSAIRDISTDGKLLLFDESGEAGGTFGAVYLRKLDGSPAVRLGDGISSSLSEDSKWVLSIANWQFERLQMLPTGTGQPESIPLGNISCQSSNWLPNGHQIILFGVEPNHSSRIYLMDVPQGQPRPITPDGVSIVSYTHYASPDGKHFLAVEADGTSSIRSTVTDERKSIPGLQEGEIAFGWTGDAQGVYVYRPAVPARVFEIDLASGRRKLWKELNPPDPAGINFIRTPHISADGKAYAYNFNRILSDLYLVDGLK